jgi:glucose-6-phosphate 1-dehydrogenase
VNAYRQETQVARDSHVETYAALRLEIDNWRWAGVPFYLRTGKYLSRRNTEIAICFKQAPYTAFQDTPVDTLRPIGWFLASRRTRAFHCNSRSNVEARQWILQR